MNERASFLCDVTGNTVTVYIRGEIDHHTAVLVRNGIDGMLFEKRPQRMILDLSAVGFMDSSGLGLIMGRLSVMKSLGGEMSIQNPSRETENILSLAGIQRLIPVAYTNGEERSENGAKKSYVQPEATLVSASMRKGASHGGRGQNRQRSKTSGRKGVKTPTTPA